ncbi:hypothetical protein HMPREF9946_04816 [Acetobacteraceae bacterium AT-5844]|nr:hypothetical protein HMPREF9946_04816 [Acetobacteraceae bacterium AT-5844]
MEPQEHGGPPGGGLERRWSWPRAALFIIVCSVLGWLLIVWLLRGVLH